MVLKEPPGGSDELRKVTDKGNGMNRSPAVADRFYPGSQKTLSSTVDNLIAATREEQTEAYAVVSPHAGYIYSGPVAGKTLSAVNIPETVIILGPNHHGQGASIALSMVSWEMPLGTVPIDTEIADSLVRASEVIKEDELAHRFEHSLEVQVPILQKLQPQLHIVPMVISSISYPMCDLLAKTIAEVIKESGKPILLVASSDMSHYESRNVAREKDQLALDKIMAMDPEGLYTTVIDRRISMCGAIPVTIALKASMLLGARKASLIEYTDSGEMSGNTDQVVGYAGVVIS